MSRTPYRKSTISDVAKRARVSITTVSHFVSGRTGTCSAETALRIEAALSELHYTPNSMSKGLSKNATRIIGVSVSNPTDDEDHPFADRVWRGINREADAQDYSLLHYPASIRDNEDYRVFLDGRVDGLIISAGMNDPRIVRLADAGMPMVLVGGSEDLPNLCGAVCADEHQTIDLLLCHLWELGHRNIAHLAGPCDLISDETVMHAQRYPADPARRRRDAFRSWMESRNAQYLISKSNTSWLPTCTAESLAEWRKLLDPPTAIVCANDVIALAAMENAKLLGWNVPREVSIVGIDASRDAAVSIPPLSTVEIDAAALGRQSLRTLLDLMDGAPIEKCRLSLPLSRLIVRSSSAAASVTNA